ncbi:ThiF family adenylyltransferase [Aquabacterium sp. A3]|uniref:ThiF family adenylyltransferase n=1 Tax=Aquabacterium sp. A3 TaxID=3132829 RepID=UPI00311A3923
MLLEVLKAAGLNKDVDVIGAVRSKVGTEREGLIVDVHCDSVSTHNTLGLRSPERFALLHTGHAGHPPAVYAMRKNFPDAMHLNLAPPGSPRALCLYFEPDEAVMRGWTPQRFFKRIQWWMQGSAAGTIHAVDQPVEQPFFETGYELVLPRNFDALRADKSVTLGAFKVEPARADGICTVRLLQTKEGAGEKSADVIYIDCPAVRHGTRVSSPETLGQLAEELSTRGVDLGDILRKELASLLTGRTEKFSLEGRSVIVLLNIPVQREEGGREEVIQRLAFFAQETRQALGLALGTYMNLKGTVSVQLLIGGVQPEERGWRDIKVAAAQVLFMPDEKALRRFSAVKDEGPVAGVVVGVGSLGSEMLSLWARCGWGKWSVVDPDHIKPHNLARHLAFNEDVGVSKALVVRHLVNAAVELPRVVNAVAANACDETPEIKELFKAADLVVDCSTTLEFPRRASLTEHAARHVSAFVTPSGNGSVLLVEDRARRFRLSTLEAQYYRAIINSVWGTTHLKEHAGKYFSGASCRDISYEQANSTIVVHAANLAEQLRRHIQPEGAAIQIWERDATTGAVAAYDVPVESPLQWDIGDFTVHADEGLVRKLRTLREPHLPAETGGVLLGYHDLKLRQIVIVDVLAAPPDSKGTAANFERGVQGLLAQVQAIQERTGQVVGYLGEWHSHPDGHSVNPSTDDKRQLAALAIAMAEEGLPFLQVIVGKTDLGVHLGEVR